MLIIKHIYNVLNCNINIQMNVLERGKKIKVCFDEKLSFKERKYVNVCMYVCMYVKNVLMKKYNIHDVEKNAM